MLAVRVPDIVVTVLPPLPFNIRVMDAEQNILSKEIKVQQSETKFAYDELGASGSCDVCEGK